MSDDETFLARWSRRKRDADRDAAARSDEQIPSARTEREESAEQNSESQVDLSQLPSLDSITSTTDIRAFLARGVPAALTREALRRAWAADPAIRDFIGPAENSWDFTAPGGVPGFGPMLPSSPAVALGDAAEPLRELGGSMPASAGELDSPKTETLPPGQPAPEAATAHAEADAHAFVTKGRSTEDRAQETVERPIDPMADKQNQDVASQEASNADEAGTMFPRRRHGGALPG